VNRLLDFREFLAILSSQIPLILITVVTGLGIALLYLALATPEFTAVSRLLVQTQGQKILNIEDVLPGLGADTSVVESQVQILRSRPVVERAIHKIRSQGETVTDEMRGTHNPPGEQGGTAIAVKDQTAPNGSTSPSSEKQGHEPGGDTAQFEEVVNRINAQRLGLSYIIDVSYRDTDPNRAAQIANALADAYIEDQIDVKYRATRLATAWLEERIAEQSGKVRASEERAQEYMAKNGLVDLGEVKFGQREVADATLRQSVARAKVSEAQARLQQLQELAKSDQFTTASNGTDSSVISELRRQLAERKRKLAELIGRLGEQHPSVGATKADIESLSHQIDLEIGRRIKSVSSELELDNIQAELIDRNLETLKKDYVERNRRAIGLAELKRNAEADRQLYEQLLKRHKETHAQLSLQTADARVVAYADTPLHPSSPRVGGTLALAALGSLGLGTLIAIMRGGTNVVLRSAADVERLIGVKTTAVLPKTNASTRTTDASERESANKILDRLPCRLDDAAYVQGIFTLRQWLCGSDRRLRRTVLVASPNSGDGKSTVALNLAQCAAKLGLRALLIDGDLRTRSLSLQLVRESSHSIVDVVADNMKAAELPVPLQNGGFDFYPAGIKVVTDPMEVLACSRFEAFLEALARKYDLVIVDTPPLLSFVDTCALFRLADTAILVVHANRTSRDDVCSALTLLPADMRIGIVLNATVATPLRVNAFLRDLYTEWKDRLNRAVISARSIRWRKTRTI
jgi:polysaccharide biosynthesis transport protein